MCCKFDIALAPVTTSINNNNTFTLNILVFLPYTCGLSSSFCWSEPLVHVDWVCRNQILQLTWISSFYITVEAESSVMCQGSQCVLGSREEPTCCYQRHLEGSQQLWGMWANMCLWTCMLQWKVDVRLWWMIGQSSSLNNSLFLVSWQSFFLSNTSHWNSATDLWLSTVGFGYFLTLPLAKSKSCSLMANTLKENRLELTQSTN